MKQLFKYPRTHHLEGSRRQPGDEELDEVGMDAIRGRYVVIEEKVDGANAALSFNADGELWLQSRGHFLTGGEREKHFALFKTWAACHQGVLYDRLGDRYTVYGEWLYAKHTVFYDQLPHYFLEFDVLDGVDGRFLSTEGRRELLRGLPVVSVPVLYAGDAPGALVVERSLYKSVRWRDALREEALRQGLDAERALRETDPSDRAEGLYIKVEEDGAVIARYKFVRASFLTAVLDSGSHWLSRPILPNLLAEGASLY